MPAAAAARWERVGMDESWRVLALNVPTRYMSCHTCGFGLSLQEPLDGTLRGSPHGRRGRRRTVQEKLEPSLNFYVTVMKRSDDTEPVQITLDPVFDVDSDGGLENGCSLRRFRAMLIRNFQVAGGTLPQRARL